MMTNEDAIKDIVKETCEGCLYIENCEREYCAFYLAIKALENQPRWIPVTERLPEINVEVIVTDIETIGTYASWYLGEGFWECDNGKFNNRIIAWMPLPQPYSKEEQS